MSNSARPRALSIISMTIASCIIFSMVVIIQPTSASIANCPMFPADNVWNVRVDNLPVDSRSNDYISAMGNGTGGLHPDFGSGLWQGQPIGIPYTTVLGTQPLVPINFTMYGSESDPGPYPIPPNAPIEGGSDRHVLVVDTTNCKLYELFKAFPQNGGASWNAASGAVFTLTVNAPLRPIGWTSADAAGLPILPGLARYEEVASGIITHALRFTSNSTANQYIWPARHKAAYNPTANSPPMGQRFRLRSSFAINPNWSPQVKVILTALKQYGMILADNGTSWYISGAPNAGWDDDLLVNQLKLVKGSDFEAVDESGLMIDPNSWQAKIIILNPALWLPLIRR